VSSASRRLAAEDAVFVWLAIGAGAVDGISFFGLGRVFTANMTGNIVLLGLAVGRASGSEAIRSGISLVVFAVAVFGAARLAGRAKAAGSSVAWTRGVTMAFAV
jgi:uncharacterized membrane protein YoaK (UPF0700 family)